MPATASFDSIGKHAGHGRKEFVPLLRIPILHDEPDECAIFARDEHANCVLKHPSETHSAFVGNPHPKKHDLAIGRCATGKREKTETLVV